MEKLKTEKQKRPLVHTGQAPLLHTPPVQQGCSLAQATLQECRCRPLPGEHVHPSAPLYLQEMLRGPRPEAPKGKE